LYTSSPDILYIKHLLFLCVQKHPIIYNYNSELAAC